jgi:hypothetical protein
MIKINNNNGYISIYLINLIQIKIYIRKIVSDIISADI